MTAEVDQPRQRVPVAYRDRIRLGTLKNIRQYTALIIRQLARDKIDLQKGRTLVWAALQLHGMLKSELYPTTASGNTTNILVTGELSPARRLVDELFGRRTSRIPEALVQDRPLELAGAGDEPELIGSPVGLREVSGDTAEP